MLIFITDFIVEINPAKFNYFRYGDHQQLLDKQSLKSDNQLHENGSRCYPPNIVKYMSDNYVQCNCA
jgi:hypothetical protein